MRYSTVFRDGKNSDFKFSYFVALSNTLCQNLLFIANLYWQCFIYTGCLKCFGFWTSDGHANCRTLVYTRVYQVIHSLLVTWNLLHLSYKFCIIYSKLSISSRNDSFFTSSNCIRFAATATQEQKVQHTLPLLTSEALLLRWQVTQHGEVMYNNYFMMGFINLEVEQT